MLGEMLQRKSISKRFSFVLPVVAFASFLATYNALSYFMTYAGNVGREEVVHPVVAAPPSPKKHSKKFHVAVTATEATYSRWQSRIMYYWYKKKRDEPGSEMGKFTRILHSGKSDDLMDEIPTFVADPLPKGVDKGYVVLNRPWAFVQWLQSATIEEEYILMGEPDHVIVNPIPNLAYGGKPVAFPFFYIDPAKHEPVVRKHYPVEMGPITDIDPIGSSPVLIKKSVLEDIAPTWVNVSQRMKNDPETDKAFGWVLEMYAYAVASALHGVKHRLRKDIMIQPPWDKEIGEAFIIHYTYGCDYNMKGELTYGKIGEWRFDKRSFRDRPMPRNLSLPPPGVPQSVVNLVNMVNEATSNIPNWDVSSQ